MEKENTVHVLYVGIDNKIYHKRHVNGAWVGDEWLGANAGRGADNASSLAVGIGIDGICLFYAKTDGEIWRGSLHSTGSYYEEPTGGSGATHPTVVQAFDGQLFFFYVGGDKGIWHGRLAGFYHGDESTHASGVRLLSVSRDPADQLLHIFYVNDLGEIWNGRLDPDPAGGPYQGDEQLFVHDRATDLTTTWGQFIAYIRNDNTVQCWRRSIGAEPPKSMTFIGSPGYISPQNPPTQLAAMRTGDGTKLHLFCIFKDDSIRHWPFDGAAWGPKENVTPSF